MLVRHGRHRLIPVFQIPLTLALLALGPSDLLEMQDFPVRPTAKTFVVTEQLPIDELRKLDKLSRTGVRLVLKGNMIRDSWVAALNDLDVRRIEVVLGPELLRSHITQLKRINRLAVVLDMGGARFKPAMARELGALGPVRKTIVLRPGFTKSSLEKYTPLRTWDVLLDARDGGLSAEDLAMIAELPVARRVLVRSGLAPEQFAKLGGVKGLELIVEVEKNALNEDQAAALAALGVPKTLLITDAIDEEKYKALFAAGAFDLQIVCAKPESIRVRALDLIRRTDP